MVRRITPRRARRRTRTGWWLTLFSGRLFGYNRITRYKGRNYLIYPDAYKKRRS